MKRVLSLVGGFLLTLSMSQAGIAVNFVAIGAAGAGPNGGTVFTYDIDISPDATVQGGTDYFVIYDFGPVLVRCFPIRLVGDLELLSSWAQRRLRKLPMTLQLILNTRINKIGTDLSGPAFDNFSDLIIELESPFPNFVNGTLNVSSQFLDTSSTPGSGGDTIDITVPETGIPEPGTMGLLGAGLFGLVYALRQRSS